MILEITMSNREVWTIDAKSIIASMALYYVEIDGFKGNSPEYFKHIDVLMNVYEEDRDSVCDYIQNNIDIGQLRTLAIRIEPAQQTDSITMESFEEVE